ncbi:MFS transporter [Niallia taxi]|uniref:MFS transporter n=1 Tax=Niallia taxi TaxID=2499688 RepID=A0A3S2TX52_9BACI|nr:MFS transporter [Niallia taxi]MCM3216241.1 MFS transporter [Niallia taxi]MDK8643079.1 MFS transporter [Niallia taxi]MED4053047.1 MFS transporter [Niallia taxi]MED4118887.1 MFS transporter [Niallia taxi]RVT67782.1 MFS transporter [Niallia taxi]
MASDYRISMLVIDQPGVLARISNLFGAHEVNIESIQTKKYKETTRIRIASNAEEQQVQNLIVGLQGLLDVVDIDASAIARSAFQQRLMQRTSSIQVMREQRTLSKKMSFWLVACCLFLTLFGTNIPASLYTLYRQEWGLSSGMITLVFAIYAFTVIPAIIVAGQLSDQIGRKKVLIPGILFSIIGTACFTIADGLGMLLLARLFQGLSVGILNGVAVAALTELDEKRDKKKTALICALAVTLGNAIGPILSGLLGDFAPFPLRLSYYVHLLFILPCFAALFFLNENVRPGLQPVKLKKPYVPKSMLKSFILASITSFLAWSIISMFMSLIPANLSSFTQVHSLTISGIVVALGLIAAAANQILLKQFSLRTMITIGYILLTLGLILLVITLAAKSLVLLLISAVLIGGGNGPAYAGSLALINERSPSKTKGNIVSTFFVITYLGVSLPVIGLGFLSQILGVSGAVNLYVLIIGIVMLITIMFGLKERKNIF